MNEKVVFDQLNKDVADQTRVRQTYKYFNGTDRSKGLYDEAVRMGEDVLKEHEEGHNEPQAMVDLVDQAIYNSRKALNGQQTDKHSLHMQLSRAGQFLRSQEFTGLPIKTQQYWEREIAAAHNVEVASTTDQALANKTAIKVATMFDTMEQMRPQLVKEAAQQRAARAKKAIAARKEAEKERKKREAVLAKQKALAEKAAKEHRGKKETKKKKSGGLRGFWSFLGFHKNQK
ncbi:hypothetical protein EAI26_09710 [Lactobacillus sp. 0.1XD8-4]|uniref:Uncharacterized protein n=1 Tax=Limosilactobacillus walteri TaxID=2268022 RepID=A0ABR8P7Q1_9LACO|nr:hypothetical protein [Limosilactobacillus walteri]MBD5806784.1 hypothetical protein [Limosilactobacillus walteri]MRN07650.1 hypothetical protein [Lactobacillus sp. 0.1XD8-4]